MTSGGNTRVEGTGNNELTKGAEAASTCSTRVGRVRDELVVVRAALADANDASARQKHSSVESTLHE